MYQMQLDPLPNLIIYGKKKRPAGWSHDKVTKNHHFLFINLEGECSFIIDKKEKKVNKNSALFIPKGTPYASRVTKDSSHLFFYFDAHISPPYEKGTRLGTEGEIILPMLLVYDATVLYYLDCIFECNEKNVYDWALCRAMLLMGMIRMAKLTESGVQKPLVLAIEKYLLENLDKNVTLDSLAEKYGYSKQYIIRIFKEGTGQTPMTYLHDIRLQRSRIALLDESKSISEIARECGFEDANYFSRAFRRRYSTSPVAYRKAAQTP